MRRQVTAHLELEGTEPALLALQIAVATPAADEQLISTQDGARAELREVAAPHGGRVHVVDAERGHLMIDYSATVDGHMPSQETTEYDLLSYRRPRRHCPSDRFLATAAAEFGEIDDPAELVRTVRRRVHCRLIYLSGSSGPSDDAVDTLLLGEGVCRDYAHLVLALLRARDVPARLVAAYAPGLSPMAHDLRERHFRAIGLPESAVRAVGEHAGRGRRAAPCSGPAGQALARSIEMARTVAWPRQSSAAAGE